MMPISSGMASARPDQSVENGLRARKRRMTPDGAWARSRPILRGGDEKAPRDRRRDPPDPARPGDGVLERHERTEHTAPPARGEPRIRTGDRVGEEVGPLVADVHPEPAQAVDDGRLAERRPVAPVDGGLAG